MPRKRKRTAFPKFTKREIESLESLAGCWPMVLIIFIGAVLIIWIAVSLRQDFGVSRGFTDLFAIIAILILIVISPIGIILYERENQKELDRKYRGIQIANIDTMSGIEFEQYLQKLLINQGYRVQVTQASGDLGVDLVASRNDDKIAIQAKRYNVNVSRRAISDAVAGINYYGCNKAMVITNNYFSLGAVTLANSTGCTLIDRDTLAKWVNGSSA